MALLDFTLAAADPNNPNSVSTPEAIAKRQALADALMKGGMDYSPVQSPWQGAARMAQALAGTIQNRRLEAQQAAGQKTAADQFAAALGGGQGAADPQRAAMAQSLAGGVADAPGNIPPVKPNDISSAFLDTLRSSGLQNPNALAAVGATGARESGWDGSKAASTWADPSESGQAGVSGGALSWRAERLKALQNFAVQNGEQGNGSAATQAKFFLQENPQLIAGLNATKTPEEAMSLMNNAWKFAGYNRPGGEASARIAEAQKWAGKVASADPAFALGQAPTQGAPMAAQGPISVPGYEGKFSRDQANDGDGVPSQAEWDAASKGSAGTAPVQVAQAGTGASPAVPASPQSKANLQALMQVANNPWSMPAQKQIATELIKKQMGENPIDLALKQEQLRKAQRDNEAGQRQTTVDINGQKYTFDPTAADPNSTLKPLGAKSTPAGADKVQFARENWQSLGLPDPQDPKNAGYWQNLSTKAIGGGAAVEVNMGDKANQSLDKNIIDDIQTSKGKAASAVSTLEAIAHQRQALDGGMITGWGADWRTQGRNALATLLGIDDPKVINSNKFDAAATQKGAELAKQISNAGHTTNADLQIGQVIAGGDRSKLESAIRSIVDAQEILAKRTIEQHNGSVEKFKKIMPDAASRADWYKVEAPDFSQVYPAGKPRPTTQEQPQPNKTKTGITWSVQ